MQEKKLTAGIYTLGCKVNQYESEAISEELVSRGIGIAPASELCDILKGQFTGGFSYSGVTGSNITWGKDGYVSKGAVKYTLKLANSATDEH